MTQYFFVRNNNKYNNVLITKTLLCALNSSTIFDFRNIASSGYGVPFTLAFT